MSAGAVGDLLILKMREENVFSVLSRDGVLGDVGRDLDLPMRKGMRPHPISYMDLAAARLEYDPRFEKSRVWAHNIAGRACVLKCFTLREPFR